MIRLWCRFANHSWTLPLLVMTYVPSMLTLPITLYDVVPALVDEEPWKVAFAIGTLLSFGAPLSAAAAWIGRTSAPERVTPAVVGWVVLVSALLWPPHHFAICIWGLWRAVRQGGLVP